MQNYEHKVVVVAGGTGGVGEGIVKWFADQGATVLIPSRNVDNKKDHLNEYLGDSAERVHLIQGNISEEDSAEKIREEITAKYGDIDAMVAALGGWWQGTDLVDLKQSVWEHIIDTGLTSHFVVAKTFIPAIKEGGSYTFIAGFSAYKPYRQAGPIAVAGAGQLMLRKIFSIETEGSDKRINDLILGPINTRKRGPRYQSPNFLHPEEIGRFVGFMAFEDGGNQIANETIHLEEKGDVEAEISKRGYSY